MHGQNHIKKIEFNGYKWRFFKQT